VLLVTNLKANDALRKIRKCNILTGDINTTRILRVTSVPRNRDSALICLCSIAFYVTNVTS